MSTRTEYSCTHFAFVFSNRNTPGTQGGADGQTGFFSLYKNIIAIPSISSTDTRWDQSNEAVIRLLADWFGQLGFQCEVTALPDLPGKFNLVATYGQGEGGCCSRATRIRFPSMKEPGPKTPSR